MTVLGVILGAFLGFVCGNRVELSGYRRLPASRRLAAMVTELLRSFAFGIPTGAALAGVHRDSPSVAVGLALLSFTVAYCLSGPLTRIVSRRGNAGDHTMVSAALQAVLGSGAVALGIVVGGALVT